MDIELAVTAMEMAPHIDQMVLFSGDGDFRSLVEAVQRQGVRVSVVSTVATQPPMVADELRRQADEFVDLTQLMARIGRDPSERAARIGEPRRQGSFAPSQQQPADDVSARLSRRARRGLRRQSPRGLSGLRAAGAISRRQSRRLSRLAQRAGRTPSATRKRACSSSAWRRACAAPIAPGARSPATAPASSFMRRCSNSISRAASTTGGPTTGSSCAIARSSTRCAASPREQADAGGNRRVPALSFPRDPQPAAP